MRGLSWLAVLSTSSLPPATASHAQPLPNRVVPAADSCSLNGAKPPNACLIASASAARLAAAALTGRCHDRPEQRVVVLAAPVVAHRRTDVLRDACDAAEQRLEALLVQRGMLVERRVQVVHIGLMMLAVVDLHGLGVDVRLERGVVVGQRRQRMLVGFLYGCGCWGHRPSPLVCGSVSMSTRDPG